MESCQQPCFLVDKEKLQLVLSGYANASAATASAASTAPSDASPKEETEKEVIPMWTRDDAYPWQRALEAVVMSRNCIVMSGTGTGKTFLAVRMLSEMKHKNEAYLSVFVTPSVPLAMQQERVLSRSTTLKVILMTGATADVTLESKEAFDAHIKGKHVLVCTAQVLLDTMKRKHIRICDMDAIVLDEAHHVGSDKKSKHPYRLICEDLLQEEDASLRPRVLALTASPVPSAKASDSDDDIATKLSALEHLLNARLLVSGAEAVAFDGDQVTEIVYEDERTTAVAVSQLQEAAPGDLHGKHVSAVAIARYELGRYGEYFVARERREQVLEEELSPKQRSRLEKEGVEAWEASKVACLERLSGIAAPNNLDEDNALSIKVIRLCEHLDKTWQHESQKRRALIFVDRRDVAVALAEVLKLRLCKYARVGVLLGHSRSGAFKVSYDMKATQAQRVEQCQANEAEMKQTLNRFASGDYNLLVASPVAEEGLDVAACALVVLFSRARTLRSYLQSRGRARAEHSRLVVLVNEADGKAKRPSEFHELERRIINVCVSRGEQLEGLSYCLPSMSWKERYVVEKTGAEVTIDTSIATLNRFLQSLRVEQWWPIESLEPLLDGWKCTLELCDVLPANVRYFSSSACQSKRVARGVVAVAACAALHRHGLLSDSLLPIVSHDHLDDATKKKMQLPMLDDNRLKVIDKRAHLLDLRRRALVHLATTSEPSTTKAPSIVYFNNDSALCVVIVDEIVDDIRLISFHSNLLAMTSRLFSFAAPVRHLLPPLPALLLAPYDVSNQCVDYVMLESCFKSPNLVSTTHNHRMYKLDAAMDSLERKPMSEAFPSDNYTSFLDYYAKRHHEKLPPCTKMMAALPLSAESGDEQSICWLPLPLVRRWRLDWRYGSVRSSTLLQLLSSAMHVAKCSLFSSLMSNIIPLPPLSPLLHAAMATLSARLPFDCERLEFVGDAVLKFITARHFYTHLPIATEGTMTSLLMEVVSNDHLERAGVHWRLHEFVSWLRSTDETRVPPFGVLFDPKSQSDDGKQWQFLRGKRVADCVEALLGALAVTNSGGSGHLSSSVVDVVEGACVSCRILSNAAAESPPVSHDPAHYSSYSSLKQRIEYVQEILSYKFKSPWLLVEALTPPGAASLHERSYQRLEFLGDAFIDAYVAFYLYSSCASSATPGDLTFMKRAIVRSESLAAICTRSQLYQSIRSPRNALSSSMDFNFDEIIATYEQETALEDVALFARHGSLKLLADVIESVVGAVLVDGGIDAAGDVCNRLFNPRINTVLNVFKQYNGMVMCDAALHLHALFQSATRVHYDLSSLRLSIFFLAVTGDEIEVAVADAVQPEVCVAATRELASRLIAAALQHAKFADARKAIISKHKNKD